MKKPRHTVAKHFEAPYTVLFEIEIAIKIGIDHVSVVDIFDFDSDFDWDDPSEQSFP